MTKNLADDLQRTARQAMTGLTPTPQGEESGGLPFRRLLAAAFRARYLVFATTLFGVLVGAFLALTTPNNYLSEGKFAFTGTGAEGIDLDPTRTKDTSQETITTTATYILNSHDLLRKVVDRLTPARILEPYQPGTGHDAGAKGIFYRIQRDWNATKNQEATPEEALKRLLKTVSLDHPRYTPVLVATCSANNPVLAQEILAAFMEEAIKWHIKQYDDESAYEEAERRFKDTKIAVDKARFDMNEFLERKAQVPNYDAEKRRLETDAFEASTALQRQMNETTMKKDSRDKLAKQLDNKEIPEEKIENRPVDFTSGSLRRLDEQYGAATTELSRLKRTRVPGHEDITRQEAVISDIRQSIQTLLEEARKAPLESVKIPNPEYVQATAQRITLSLEVSSLEAGLQYAEKRATDTRDRLKKFLELEPEFTRLRDTLAHAEDGAKSATFLWNAAQEKKALSVGKFSSLKEIQAATLPLEKEGPNRSKLLLGAFFVGLFLGLGIVILRALPDSVVRTRDDLEKMEGLPVIGVMPRLDGGNLRRHVSLREQGW